MKKRMKNMVIILSIFAIFLLLFLIYWLLGANTDLQTVNYTVSSDKITSPIRVALVSDLHSCKYGEDQQELIDAIAAQSPDIVLLAGDIYDDKLPDALTDTFLKALGARFRCFYIPGNHELRKFKDGNVDELLLKVSSYGIAVLYGEYEEITVNGNTVTIYGLMEEKEVNDFSAQSFSELCKASDTESYAILMAHRPSRIDTYLTGNFDLIVAGHAHGGQWCIPGLLNGLLAPEEGLFPKYAGGQYDFENATMIVSRGLARESTIVPRIFNPPELVIIDILPENT